jgi:chromate reductase, NAD(P)H dehydrogenase (quinone)
MRAHATLALSRREPDVADLKILGISGSLRKNSYNTAALKACADMMPPDMKMTMGRIDDIPLFNQDVFDAGLPEPVKRFRNEVAAADGLLIASPEYNFSVTAALKNAIDWGSRPPDQVFQDKPIALFSASQGPLGGARVQYDLRRILGQLWGHVLPRPEVFIGSAPSKFDAQGKITDEATRKFLADLVTSFRTWILRMQVKK